ncbi:hypothetical protein AYWB_328 [Aster yellows witches'-broom phytoplasma AYWB]|uniref:Uncharacterized protein n=1 Tax=Aster yellows witches'-broom phytoplasma (strain AYWB) TaxID=322098 RepID=Q2NJE8_AYWBP|nr:hypothetical protein AYWB_328 [Aster yellows witches'-broom phytoplasma AYWB]
MKGLFLFFFDSASINNYEKFTIILYQKLKTKNFKITSLLKIPFSLESIMNG